MALAGTIDKAEIVYQSILIAQKKGTQIANTPENRAKQRQSLARIKHQQGERNSQYGKRWVHNKSLRTSKRIGNTAPLPKGWEEGRIVDFDAYDNKIKKREINKIKNKQARETHKQEKIKFYTEWYKIYEKTNFKEFCQITGYNKSQQNLCSMFKTFVKEYTPRAVNKYKPQ
jgi:hypothetical protein